MKRLLLKVTNCVPLIKSNTFRLAISPPLPVRAAENNNITIFNINDYVKNNDNLYGIVKDKKNNYIIINWNDDTHERIGLQLIENNYLQKITQEEYNENCKVNNINSELRQIDSNIKNDIDNTKFNEIEKPDVEKLKLQKKVNDLEEKLANKKINKLKEDTAKEIIDLAIMKGIIDEQDSDMELLRVMAMSDDEFKKYEDNVLHAQKIEGEISSANQQNEEDYTGLSKKEIEAKQALAKLRAGGLTSSNISNFNNLPTDSGSSRTLSNIKYDNSKELPETMEESLLRVVNNLNNSENKILNNTLNNSLNDPFQSDSFQNNELIDDIATHLNNNFNIQSKKVTSSNQNSFLNTPFEGLTKPLSLGNNSPAVIAPSNSDYSTLLEQLDWTMPGNRKR